MNEETTKSPALTETVAEVVQALADILADILNPIIEVVKIAIKDINEIWEGFMRDFSNPRVYHLALHAKTQRARKKNRRRMMLDFQRYCRKVRNEK